MWFKKKSVLQADGHYDTEKSANGTSDMRTTYQYYENSSSSIRNSGLPSAADAGNYFYLPALGRYSDSGKLEYMGDKGYYWSSSAHPWSYKSAYALYFYSGSVYVDVPNRSYGLRVGGFE